MKTITFILFSLLAVSSYSQSYQVGHTTITFNDASRTGGFGSGGGAGRQIQTEIYYPADMVGEDVDLASGEFPIVVVGHGFAMAWDAYDNIWSEMVPHGFILAFPRTESGLFPGPSHSDFGLDLAIIETELENEGLLATSLFYNHLSYKSAIMGHSMGGGATILAAENNTSIDAIIGLAPAETTPSAITAASNVTVPALIFTADEDMVTPSVDHHTPIYDNLNSSCKYLINVIGGAHCYYANSNFNCDFGESTSGGNISVTREEQQAIMFTYVIAWLKIYLYDDCGQQSVFDNDLALDNAVIYQNSCTSFPEPSFDLTVSVNGSELVSNEIGTIYQWIDCDNNIEISGETNQNFTPTVNGNYGVILGSGICSDTSNCVSINTVGIYENSENILNKEIMMITDVLGRETNFKPNILLIYIYADGTKERLMIIE